MFRDEGRRQRTIRPEPGGGPVQGAEERAGRDGGIDGAKQASPHAVLDECADAALVRIALDHNRRPQALRQGMNLDMRRRSFDLIDQAEDVGDGKVVKPRRERAAPFSGAIERGEQTIERAPLAEEEQLVLAFEVVIQVPGRQVGRRRDLAHPGRGETHRPERPRCRPENLHPAPIRPV